MITRIQYRPTLPLPPRRVCCPCWTDRMRIWRTRLLMLPLFLLGLFIYFPAWAIPLTRVFGVGSHGRVLSAHRTTISRNNDPSHSKLLYVAFAYDLGGKTYFASDYAYLSGDRPPQKGQILAIQCLVVGPFHIAYLKDRDPLLIVVRLWGGLCFAPAWALITIVCASVWLKPSIEIKTLRIGIECLGHLARRNSLLTRQGARKYFIVYSYQKPDGLQLSGNQFVPLSRFDKLTEGQSLRVLIREDGRSIPVVYEGSVFEIVGDEIRKKGIIGDRG